MVPTAWLCLRKGPRCSVLVKYLQPSKTVDEALVNPVAGQRIDDLIAVKHEMTTRGGKNFYSNFYRSKSIPGVLLSSAKQWATVLEQVPGLYFGTRTGWRLHRQGGR